MSVGRPSDHDSIDSIAVECFPCLLWGINVAVTDDGDVHPRVFLYLSYECPVCLSFVHLAPGPPVDRKCLDTYILQPLSKFDDNLRVLIPSEPCLDSNRKFHGIHYHSGNFHHLVRLPHHS